MPRLALLPPCLFVLASTAISAQTRHPVLMISVDGMRPDSITRADEHGLKVPVLRGFLKNGVYAEGVQGVLPTVTYPSHTTMVTGVWPVEHGIANNTTFDPLGTDAGGWNWYGKQVKVPTLWQAAKAAGLTTASIYWPVTVGAQGIDYNVPEYFRARNGQDRYLEEALSSPTGFLVEMEQASGAPFEIHNSEPAFDEMLTKTTIAVIHAKKPDFLTLHLVSLDHVEHGNGPHSAEANAVLESLDSEIGRIIAAERAEHADADILIVSDHGFYPTSHHLQINAALKDAGLLTPRAGSNTAAASYKAIAWEAGGTAAIFLSDPKDDVTRKVVADLLAKLKADPANGIREVLDTEAVAATGGFPGAAFVLEAQPGWSFGNSTAGPVLQTVTAGGAHGYLPTRPDLRSSFFMEGPGIAKGRNLGVVDMRQIAPTVAGELGISLPAAKMAPLPLR